MNHSLFLTQAGTETGKPVIKDGRQAGLPEDHRESRSGTGGVGVQGSRKLNTETFSVREHTGTTRRALGTTSKPSLSDLVVILGIFRTVVPGGRMENRMVGNRMLPHPIIKSSFHLIHEALQLI